MLHAIADSHTTRTCARWLATSSSALCGLSLRRSQAMRAATHHLRALVLWSGIAGSSVSVAFR